MSAYHGRSLDLPNLLSFDMGGTTAKGALVRGGAPIKRYSMEVARVHEFRQGSGLPIRIPAIDMIEIGAGGGSIAEIDERGLLRVGPRSAGADPGPACYGRGGTKPTLTDANLVLGYLDAGFFLGGTDGARPRRRPRRRSATASPSRSGSRRCARPGASTTSSARTWRAPSASTPASAASTTARAAWWRSAARGRCMRWRIARKLKIPRVVFPVGAGVMSALGLLISPLAFEMARSRRIHVADIDAADFAATFRALETRGQVVPAERRRRRAATSALKRRLDMRYQGQGHEIEVTLPDAAGRRRAVRRVSASCSAAPTRPPTRCASTSRPRSSTGRSRRRGRRPISAPATRLSGPAGTAQPLKGTRLAYDPDSAQHDRSGRSTTATRWRPARPSTDRR